MPHLRLQVRQRVLIGSYYLSDSMIVLGVVPVDRTQVVQIHPRVRPLFTDVAWGYLASGPAPAAAGAFLGIVSPNRSRPGHRSPPPQLGFPHHTPWQRLRLSSAHLRTLYPIHAAFHVRRFLSQSFFSALVISVCWPQADWDAPMVPRGSCDPRWPTRDRPVTGVIDQSSLYRGNFFRALAMSATLGCPYFLPSVACVCPVMASFIFSGIPILSATRLKR